MGNIITQDRSIIPACDVGLGQFADIVRDTNEYHGIGGYKVGFVALGPGIESYVAVARQYTDKPIIYDHQKAGTDIPDTGEKYARLLKESGVDAAIIFPREDDLPTQYRWTRALQDNDIPVIVGGELTSKPATPAAERIYWYAIGQEVDSFVVPGNKPERVEYYRKNMEKVFKIEPVFFAPGFVKQGGKISDAGRAAGERWHAIVGRGITQSDDYAKAAVELSAQLFPV